MLAGTLAANPAAMAWDPEGIPLPAGHFSYTEQGSAAECLNPTSGAPESCSASGVRVVPVSILCNGAETRDGTGNVCETEVAVVSTLPVNASPPTVQTVQNVYKLLNYDPRTGTGDESYTSYVRGACNGATFNSAGAMKIATGTVHFVVTDNGNRIDSVVTALTGAQGVASFGAFSFSRPSCGKRAPSTDYFL